MINWAVYIVNGLLFVTRVHIMAMWVYAYIYIYDNGSARHCADFQTVYTSFPTILTCNTALTSLALHIPNSRKCRQKRICWTTKLIVKVSFGEYKQFKNLLHHIYTWRKTIIIEFTKCNDIVYIYSVWFICTQRAVKVWVTQIIIV